MISALMVDKIAASPKSSIGRQIGVLSAEDMERADIALAMILGLAR